MDKIVSLFFLVAGGSSYRVLQSQIRVIRFPLAMAGRGGGQRSEAAGGDRCGEVGLGAV